MKRRRLLPTIAVLWVPGCLSGPDDTGDSRSETGAQDVESYLPEPGSGWVHEETYEPDLGDTGLDGGVIGTYRSPDDVRFDVVVILSGTAEQLLDAGWQVAVPIDEGAIAASSGREWEKSPTPEHPPEPSMEGTPVPDSDDRALDLLARSPKLTEAEVESNWTEYTDERSASVALEETSQDV